MKHTDMRNVLPALFALFLLTCCSRPDSGSCISADTIDDTVSMILETSDGLDECTVRRGVAQCAGLWTTDDGSVEDFVGMVEEGFARDSVSRRRLFDRLSSALELFYGTYDILTVALTKPLYLDMDVPDRTDYILGAYDPGAHFTEDMFANRLAFITVLNFPHYSLAEKDSLGKDWSRLEWAYARMGDVFTERIPAGISQEGAEITSDCENYIASYNIRMDRLLTEDGKHVFPEGMSLLSHWNLRDELKADYADKTDGSIKQELIYKVMERIVSQDIPEIVINSGEYEWDPFSNSVYKDGQAIETKREPDTRYQKILDCLHYNMKLDRHCPAMPDAIQRNFEGSLEMSAERIESLFTAFLSSPEVAEVGNVIRDRLGRELRPYDIWYDGFKSRSTIQETTLDAQIRSMYPDAEAFHNATPRLLENLGFSKEEAGFIASHVVVEDARGSGHAWPCMSRNEPARLRTRIEPEGMNYKGYNIAVHEFGHNVEEVLDMYHIDYYTLAGVPNSAFTEAMAFLFQCRDLQLLGYGRQKMNDDTVFDHFWSMYEIMGVSLVDMRMWQWLYANPDATAAQLREKTLDLARDIWNRYYEPVLGSHDSTILGIYSHMVNAPMYLPNYPIGHLVHFQIEQKLANCCTDAEFAGELLRIYTQGRLTPDEWMREAIGNEISIAPVLAAVDDALSRYTGHEKN